MRFFPFPESTPEFLKPLFRFLDLVVHCARRFREDQLEHVAGSLAFTTVLATVPVAVMTFGVLSMLPGSEARFARIQEVIVQIAMPSFGTSILEHVESFALNAARLGAYGAAGVVVTAIFLMHTIEATFNHLWRAPRGRRVTLRLVTYWAVLTLGPLLLGLGLYLTDWLDALPYAQAAAGRAPWVSALLSVAPFLLEVAAFTVLFAVVPNVSARLAHAVAGALFAASLFEIAKSVFVLFLSSVSTYAVLYGAVAALPVYMIWVYVSWMVILLGAILSATLHERSESDAPTLTDGNRS